LKAGITLPLAALAPLALCTLITGCAGNTNKLAQGDPLYGETQPRGKGVPAVPPPQPANNRGQVPPVPTATSSPSNAAMASTGLPGGRSLAIAQNQPNTPATPGVPTAAVNLKRPEPIVVPIPRDTPLPGPGVVPSNVLMTGSWMPQHPVSPPSQGNLVSQPRPSPVVQALGQASDDTLQAQLRSRGVSWHKKEAVPEGVKFSCIVPSPTNPESTRVFEATARDYPSAVQAVLQQIDQQR
jgi:hypothetical protein